MKTLKLLIILLSIIYFFIACGSNSSQSDQGTPLQLESVKNILANDSNSIHKRKKNGFTLLQQAVRNGQMNIVKLLLDHGADVHKRVKNKYGSTPLMLAAFYGYNDIVDLLIEKGANVNATAGEGKVIRSALTMAAWRNHKETLKLLVKHGAKVNIFAEGKLLSNPLNGSVYMGRIEMVKLLLSFGADINHIDNSGKTALFYAVINQHKDLVKLLLDHHADIRHIDKRNNTPLHMIYFWRRNDRHQKDILNMLIQKGGDINALNVNKSTALHYAAFNRLDGIVPILLAHGAEIHHMDNMNNTPLMIAHNRGANSVKQNLLSIHNAVAQQKRSQLETLIKKYPQLINACDFDFKTPLHIAVEKNNLQIARLLIASGSDIDAVSRFNSIQLVHGVVAKMVVPRVGRVKRQKADKTPLDLAMKKGFTQMARLLRNHGAK
jgi:ankyrin repeat protein